MYCEFYQLSERPFNVTPDPKFLYLNARYREAIASLNYGITQRKGFITLIGEAGTGKTTLLNKLLEDLDPKTKSVFIFNTNVTFEEILEYIFAEFDLPVHNGKKLYMLQRLNAFLLDELRGGSNVALLIDEAQDLEFSVLEDLRLLSNLETAKEKILQIVLSGQPELGQKLSNPVLRQLRQRIGINCRLLPLSRDEITEYVQYRLQAAGCPDLKLFSREAEEQIYHFSRGIPRLVNVVCDNALVIGYALGKKRIGADVINEAAADLLSDEPPAEPTKSHTAPPPVALSSAKPASRWRSRVAVAGLLIAAVTVGALSIGRTLLQRPAEEVTTKSAEPPKLEVIQPGSQPDTTVFEPAVDRPEPYGVPVAPGPERVASDEGSPAKLAAGGAPLPADSKKAESADAPLPAALGDDAPQAPKLNAGGGIADSARAEAAEPLPAFQQHAAIAPVKRALPDAAGAVPAPAGTDGVFPASGAASTKPAEVAALPPQDTPADDAAFDTAEDEPAAANMEASQQPHLDGMQFAHVQVHGGDSVSSIAMRKYGQATYTILDLLKLANPDLKDINLITVGQTLRLPELGDTFPILSDESGKYALLVYSTSQASRANALRRALHGRGFDARVTAGQVGHEVPVFRVVVSGYGDREELAGVGRQLQKLFREDTRIAQLGE